MQSPSVRGYVNTVKNEIETERECNRMDAEEDELTTEKMLTHEEMILWIFPSSIKERKLNISSSDDEPYNPST